MQRLPCFLYRDGVHFALPPELNAARPDPCQFVLTDADGRLRPHPQVFTETERPENAAVFLFPWNIGKYNDAGLLPPMEGVIASLPHLAGREQRHIVCDDGDSVACLSLPVCLIKYSVTGRDRNRAVVDWYNLPERILRDKPSFDWNGIRYDVSFVGNLSNPARKAAIVSIQQQAPELRLKADFDTTFVSDGVHCVTKPLTPEAAKVRQDLYRRSIKESLTVLCPPGVGPQSLRMHETMYLGRVPVLFGENAAYPLERHIDYKEFCLRVATADIMQTGRLLRDWLRGQSREELHARCVLACKTWNTHFRPETKLEFLLREAAELYGVAF